MLYDSITERKIEYRHVKINNAHNELKFDGDNVQINVGQKLYREQSITDDSDNVTNLFWSRNHKGTRNIKENKMNHERKLKRVWMADHNQASYLLTTSNTYTDARSSRYATRTKIQSQTLTIFLRYLNDTWNDLTRFLDYLNAV